MLDGFNKVEDWAKKMLDNDFIEMAKVTSALKNTNS